MKDSDAQGSAAASQPASRSSARRRSAVRLASDWFFGLALGLLAYQGVTDGLAARSQAALRSEMPGLTRPAPAAPAALDFSAWERDRAYWDALEPGQPFATIVCEAMDLDAVVVKGVEPPDLRRGPGWAPYTDLPGPTGNCGISGHRTTYGAPFRRIDRLRPGDRIVLAGPFTTYLYEVKRVFVVRPDQTEVFATTEEPSLTLTACHPPYSARYRIVARAVLVGATPNQAGRE